MYRALRANVSQVREGEGHVPGFMDQNRDFHHPELLGKSSFYQALAVVTLTTLVFFVKGIGVFI